MNALCTQCYGVVGGYSKYLKTDTVNWRLSHHERMCECLRGNAGWQGEQKWLLTVGADGLWVFPCPDAIATLEYCLSHYGLL